ncbi:replication factor A protein 1-like [Vigna unguiculata]|uniref:replication factor A protein 1-like n=1 Tax=Vigna unguiculata TaxID=3917 RepID=UPI001016F8A9|nr:replication factor A protein 1-like [Vigna unguiculata]
MSALQKQTQSLQELNPEKESWNIVARVVRLWFVEDYTKGKSPFSMEIVLQDKEGVLIHASVRCTLIYKFQSEIKEDKVYSIQSFSVSCNGGSYRTTNHAYKINFQFGTKVNLVESTLVPNISTAYTPFSTIQAPGFDIDYLVNVIGMFTGVGTERELEKGGKKTNMNVILIESDGYRLECTLFGQYVDMLNAFLAFGEDQYAVIALHYCKVKIFQDKVSIQNCMNCMRIIFNCDGEDATKLKKMVWDSTESPSQPLTQLGQSSKVSLEEDFIKLHPRCSIEDLKDFEQESTFVVKATIKHVLDHDDWWYTACICNKAVYPDSKMFKLRLRVIDATDSTTFVVFDRDASAMLKKSCSDILDLQDKNTVAGNLPKEFEVLIDKTYVFKVECKNDYNSKFEQSFRVKKVCMDEKIIESFSDVELKSLDVYSANEEESKLKQITNEIAPDTIAEDLLLKFTEESNDVEPVSDHLNTIESSPVSTEEALVNQPLIDVENDDLTHKESSHLENLSFDLATKARVPAIKRQNQYAAQENKKIPVKMLKKNIKIEK